MADQLLQYVETAADEADARRMLAWLALQVDFVGGRVVEPSPGKPRWQVQAFFEDAPGVSWFPDGVRRVTLLPSMRVRMGIRQ